jgi:hypothetical protein
MGRSEKSGRWGRAREAAPKKRGAVDGAGRDGRLMGRGEMVGRWGEARRAADGAGREKRRRKKDGRSMGRGERGGGIRRRVSQRVGRKWLLPPHPPLLPPLLPLLLPPLLPLLLPPLLRRCREDGASASSRRRCRRIRRCSDVTTATATASTEGDGKRVGGGGFELCTAVMVGRRRCIPTQIQMVNAGPEGRRRQPTNLYLHLVPKMTLFILMRDQF